MGAVSIEVKGVAKQTGIHYNAGMRLTAGHEHEAFQGLRYACVQVFGLLRWQVKRCT